MEEQKQEEEDGDGDGDGDDDGDEVFQVRDTQSRVATNPTVRLDLELVGQVGPDRGAS